MVILIILRKLVTKNIAFVNDIIFLQQFSCFGGNSHIAQRATPIIRSGLVLGLGVAQIRWRNIEDLQKICNRHALFWPIFNKCSKVCIKFSFFWTKNKFANVLMSIQLKIGNVHCIFRKYGVTNRESEIEVIFLQHCRYLLYFPCRN